MSIKRSSSRQAVITEHRAGIEMRLLLLLLLLLLCFALTSTKPHAKIKQLYGGILLSLKFQRVRKRDCICYGWQWKDVERGEWSRVDHPQ